MPMSSMSSGRTLPAPGPATVRLALVRRGIELFGIEYTREVLFPIIRASEIAIQPPKRVAISIQRIRTFKASIVSDLEGAHIDESIGYREFAHASGAMTIYLKIPKHYVNEFSELLMAIGYWGQASSFAHCLRVTWASPATGEYAVPLRLLNGTISVQKLVSCVASDFRNNKVLWEEIMPELHAKQSSAIQPEIYLWPMIILEQQGNHKILLRRPIYTTS